MKRIITLVVLATLTFSSVFGQIADGSIAPDFTATDVHGVEHNMYDYLDDGYTVILDISATWCGPCWNYHTSGILEEIWENHGPAGMEGVSDNTTDNVMIFMIEGDSSTDVDQLYNSNLGNWVEGTPYPIIDDASISAAYQITYYPTMFTVCENRIVQESGQISAAAHYEIAKVCAQESLPYQVENVTSTIQDGSTENTFTFNLVSGTESFIATLSTDAPADWNATIESGSNSDDVSVQVDAIDGGENLVNIKVSPGATAALANYTVSVTSVSEPGNVPIVLEYLVVSGITDLVIDNQGVATAFNIDFANGLDLAGNTSYGTITSTTFVEAIREEQLSGVEHIYYNMGWTFPSLTNDIVDALIPFLDGGGNLYISGQDIGWDTWTPTSGNGNGTAKTQAFYTDYLSADYLADGSGANSELTTLAGSNSIYVPSGNSAIIDVHSGNIYPDELEPLGNAVTIYNYNGNANKVGGIRVDENGHKVVYMGIDQGMIADVEVRNKVIQITHDWFHGLVLGVEADEAYTQIFGKNYPNPTVDFTIIPMNNLTEDVNIQLIDASGKVIFEDVINSGSTDYRLNLNGLSSGLYHYVISNEKGQVLSSPIAIQK